MKYTSVVKSGRARNGAHRDAGTIVHAVTDFDFPSWDKAVCGAEPGRRGNGWTDSTNEINCPKCLKKLAQLGK